MKKVSLTPTANPANMMSDEQIVAQIAKLERSMGALLWQIEHETDTPRTDRFAMSRKWLQMHLEKCMMEHELYKRKLDYLEQAEPATPRWTIYRNQKQD